MKFKKVKKGHYQSDLFDITYHEASSSSSGFHRAAGWRLSGNNLAWEKFGKHIFVKFDTLKQAKEYAEHVCKEA